MGIGNIGIDWKHVNNTLFAGMVDFRQKSIKNHTGNMMGIQWEHRVAKTGIDTENISMGLCQKRLKIRFRCSSQPLGCCIFSACSQCFTGSSRQLQHTACAPTNFTPFAFYAIKVFHQLILAETGFYTSQRLRNQFLHKLVFAPTTQFLNQLYTFYTN